MVRKPEVRYLYSVLQGLPRNSFSINTEFVCVFTCVWMRGQFQKMYCLTLLSLAALVLGLEQEVFSAPASTYEIIPEENIKNNLIGYESDLAEHLTPPAPNALDHYNLQFSRSEPETPYIVEIHRSHLNIKTAGLRDQKIKLTQLETEGIQKLSLSVVELLNSSKLASGTPGDETGAPEWNKLNPVVVLTNSGISLQFLNISESELPLAETPAEHKRILWDFLAKYAKNIFEEKLKELKISNKFAEVVDSPAGESSSSPFENFVNLLWRIMKFSVNYAETAFEGWTTALPDVVASESIKEASSTAAPLLAYEELSPFHEFPSQEFQFRRKDVDSIFYGRGVI